MREIKFRAWHKEKRVMLELSGLDFINKLAIVRHSDGVNAWNFEDIELMQFTGLQDKNGVDIYEGDIFHLGSRNITYTVVWHDTGLMGKQNGSTSFVGLEAWEDEIEVIGNIYENPELLEV